jgi:glycerol-3-phosphate cytidylyltransferase-like family protein
MKKVVAFGIFDTVEPNHVHHLKEAKEYGDHLTVIIIPDKILKEQKIKFNNKEKFRLKEVKELNIADKVMVGHSQVQYKIIADEKPNIVAIGHYQKFVVNDLITQLDENVQIVRTSPFIPYHL